MRTLFPTYLLVSLILASASPGQAPAGDTLINVRFLGGTATQYIAAVREATGDLNILVAPEAAEVLMPPVNLKLVSVAAAIRLLEDKANESPDRRVWLNVTELPIYATGEQQTFQVSAQVRSHRKRISDAYVWTVSNLGRPICSAISCPIWGRPALAPSASRRQAISTRNANTPRCSSRYTAPPPILRARVSPIRWGRSGPRR